MSDYKLTWITDDLAAGYAPMSYADLDLIREQGVAAIVNLCGEYCDLHEIEEKSGFEVFYLPIPDECAPDMTALEKGLAWVDDALYQGKKVLVHCRFGIGRTGTFVTAFLIRRGLGLKLAKKKLRKKRSQPATYQQWKMLKKYHQECSLSAIREPTLEQKNVVDLTSYFQNYEKLRGQVVAMLKKEKANVPSHLLCGQDTDICCCRYFELSLMEAVYLFNRMNGALSPECRASVVAKAIGVQNTILRLKKRHKAEQSQVAMDHAVADQPDLDNIEPIGAEFNRAYAKNRIRCPLNLSFKCLLFDYRPIRCLCDGISAEIIAPLKITATLNHLSRHLFWALSEYSPQGNGLYFSVADTVSGQFVQDYFNYLASL